MKRILIVVTDTNLGGVTTAAYNLANVLIDKGHAVDILDMSGAYQEADRLNEKIKRLFIKGRSRFWGITANESNGLGKVSHKLLGTVKKLTIRSGLWYRLIFSKFEPDTVYDAALAFRQCAPCYSFVLNKVNAKKKIGFIHGEKKYMVGDFSSWDKYFKDFDGIACVSDYVRGEFAEAYPDCADKFHCVYNSFDIEGIRQKSEVASSIELRSNVFRFVTIARIVNAIKQIDMIPMVCRKLLDEGFDRFQWYVIGDGPDLEVDKALAEKLGVADYVTFTGKQTNPFPILKVADLYVGTSKTEAYGMTLKEAHILGVPVVSTNYAPVNEVIVHGENGCITENTVEGLVNGLVYLMDNNAAELNILKEKVKMLIVTNDVAYAQLMKLI